MTPLARRLGKLEQIEEETRRRPMREHIYRIMERLGGTLPEAEVEDLVTRHVDAPALIRQWRDQGLSQEQIMDRLVSRP